MTLERPRDRLGRGIEATVQVVERRLVLRGASADEVEAALRQLRSNLPANIVLEED